MISTRFNLIANQEQIFLAEDNYLHCSQLVYSYSCRRQINSCNENSFIREYFYKRNNSIEQNLITNTSRNRLVD